MSEISNMSGDKTILQTTRAPIQYKDDILLV